ncbi:MAG: (d)CMP kinase [Desulfovermiculus sp.]
MAENSPFIVTVDGPAGVGKSTLTKSLAEKYMLAYLDTGAMFRALALYLGDGSWNWSSQRLQDALSDVDFRLTDQGADTTLTLNSTPIGPEIRREEVGLWASSLGQRKEIRTCLKLAQQEIGRRTSLVAEGRDMGTVVFPRAQCKIFLDATVQERARRRCLQLDQQGHHQDEHKVAKDLLERDRQDRSRTEAPLRPAEDAYVLDTTDLNLDQVMHWLLALVQKARRPA